MNWGNRCPSPTEPFWGLTRLVRGKPREGALTLSVLRSVSAASYHMTEGLCLHRVEKVRAKQGWAQDSTVSLMLHAWKFSGGTWKCVTRRQPRRPFCHGVSHRTNVSFLCEHPKCSDISSFRLLLFYLHQEWVHPGVWGHVRSEETVAQDTCALVWRCPSLRWPTADSSLTPSLKCSLQDKFQCVALGFHLSSSLIKYL